jgi:hypothetical protein
VLWDIRFIEVNPMKAKKHLSFPSLRKMLSSQTSKFSDKRSQSRTHYSLHDSVLSDFACMFFQDLVPVDKEMESSRLLVKAFSRTIFIIFK